MQYYKLAMDMTRDNDIVLHCKNCIGISLNTFVTGKYYADSINIVFYFDKKEGDIWTDYLANDKGWFIVYEKLKGILQPMNYEIQFIDIEICHSKENCIEKNII